MDGEVDQPLLHQSGESFDVAGHPGHQDARLLPGEEVQRLALEVAEDSKPELVDKALAETAGEPGPQPGGRRREAHGPDVGQSDGHQYPAVPGHDALVDTDLGEQRT